MIRGVKFVSIPVESQDRALAFYTERLGFQVATDQPFDESQRWIELRVPGAETRIVLFTPPGQEDRIGGFSNVVFWCDDVEGTHRALCERGVEFVQEPKAEGWGTSAVFQDSEGNVFALSSK